MIIVLRILLPLVVLAGAVAGAIAIIQARPPVQTQAAEVKPPLVRVLTAHRSDVQLTVTSQGTVSPRTESRVVPEVSGRVVGVADCFVPGGFFEKGCVLLEIDPSDYRQAVARARADVAARKLKLAQEEAEAAVARREWEALGGGEALPLTLRIPQVEDARAGLAAAEAAVAQAERDLERTKVRAPYAGRVREKLVDVGQFVTRGAAVATLYAVDVAEIRLPLPDDDLAFVTLPLDYRGEDGQAGRGPRDEAGKSDGGAGASEAGEISSGDGNASEGPRVTLRADFGGRRFTWQGCIVRTEGEIDPKSRMVHAVAQVEDPYGRSGDPERPPLAVGLFVEAEIQGHLAHGVVVLPRAALRGRNQVWVVGEDGRLRFRDIDLLRKTRETICVRSGLADGEQICLSPLESVTDGMRVRVVREDDASGSVAAPGVAEAKS